MAFFTQEEMANKTAAQRALLILDGDEKRKGIAQQLGLSQEAAIWLHPTITNFYKQLDQYRELGERPPRGMRLKNRVARFLTEEIDRLNIDMALLPDGDAKNMAHARMLEFASALDKIRGKRQQDAGNSNKIEFAPITVKPLETQIVKLPLDEIFGAGATSRLHELKAKRGVAEIGTKNGRRYFAIAPINMLRQELAFDGVEELGPLAAAIGFPAIQWAFGKLASGAKNIARPLLEKAQALIPAAAAAMGYGQPTEGSEEFVDFTDPEVFEEESFEDAAISSHADLMFIPMKDGKIAMIFGLPIDDTEHFFEIIGKAIGGIAKLGKKLFGRKKKKKNKGQKQNFRAEESEQQQQQPGGYPMPELPSSPGGAFEMPSVEGVAAPEPVSELEPEVSEPEEEFDVVT